MNQKDLQDMRQDYSAASLSEATVDADPIKQFEKWFDEAVQVALSADEREAIAASKAAAARGEFASDEQVRATWAKHGL